MNNDTPNLKTKAKKRSLTKTTEQILKVVASQQMPVAGVEVDLNRNIIAIRICSTPPTTTNEVQQSDEALAAWKTRHSPTRHP